jgi:hypothetical protein
MLSVARRALIHALANSVGVLVANTTPLRQHVRDDEGLVIVLDMERAGRRMVRTFRAIHRGPGRLTTAAATRIASQVARITAGLGSLRARMTDREGFNILDDMDLAASRARAQLDTLLKLTIG